LARQPTHADLEPTVRRLAGQVSDRLERWLGRSPGLAGGKRLRGVLTLMVAEALGGDPEAALESAAAVELIHTGTLLQDDWLDGDVLRRGGVPVYILDGPRRAVLTADRYFAAAVRRAAVHGPAHAAELAAALEEMVQGVLREDLPGLLRRGWARGLPAGEYRAIIDGKTARLFVSAARLGGMTAGAGPAVLAALSRYGRHLGRAYQLTDDRLDLEALDPADLHWPRLAGAAAALLYFAPDVLRRALEAWFAGAGPGGQSAGGETEGWFTLELSRRVGAAIDREVERGIQGCRRSLAGLPLSARDRALLAAFPAYCVAALRAEAGAPAGMARKGSTRTRGSRRKDRKNQDTSSR